MSSITLEVQSAKLTSEFGSISGKLRAGKWSLNLKVRLPFRESLELGTGEKPNERDMRLIIRETSQDDITYVSEKTKAVEDIFRGKDNIPIGTMLYIPAWADSDGHNAPASIFYEVYAPAEVMASLVRFTEQGRFPKRPRSEALPSEAQPDVPTPRTTPRSHRSSSRWG